MARREKETIEFIFSTLECKIIEGVLEAIIRNYQLPADELDAKSAAVWYSTRGCRSAQMSAAETADWIKQLQAVRSRRLHLSPEYSWSREWCQSDSSVGKAKSTMAVLFFASSSMPITRMTTSQREVSASLDMHLLMRSHATDG